MRLEWLQSFLSVVKHNSYSLAADEQFSTQSNISKHIFHLEQELGVSLFERSTRSIHITPAGQALIPYAEFIAKSYNEMLEMAETYKTERMIDLDIVSVPFMHIYDLPNCLINSSQLVSSLNFQISETTLSGVVNKLKETKMAIGILRACGVQLLSSRTEWAIFPFAQDEMVVMLSSTHPLSTQNSVSLRDVLLFPMIALQSCFDECKLVLKEHKLSPSQMQPSIKCTSVVSLMHYISSSLAISLIPGKLAQQYSLNQKVVSKPLIEHPDLSFVIAARKDLLSRHVSIEKLILFMLDNLKEYPPLPKNNVG